MTTSVKQRALECLRIRKQWQFTTDRLVLEELRHEREIEQLVKSFREKQARQTKILGRFVVIVLTFYVVFVLFSLAMRFR